MAVLRMSYVRLPLAVELLVRMTFVLDRGELTNRIGQFGDTQVNTGDESTAYIGVVLNLTLRFTLEAASIYMANLQVGS